MARGKASDKRTINILESQLDALELRKAGFSYRKIGERLKISHQTAYDYVHKAMDHLRALGVESAEELREIDLLRIDRAIEGIMHWIDAGSPAHVTALKGLINERAKLLGLYAPEKQEININIALLQQFETLASELNVNAGDLLEAYIQQLHALKSANS